MKFQLCKQLIFFTIWFSVLFIFYVPVIIYSSALHKEKYKNRLSDHQLTSPEAGTAGATPWSNAFNFKGVWGAQIDPGTGVLSVHVKAGNLLSNLGHGPDVDLEVNYSSNANTNIDGLGTGWSWNLTHFSPLTNSLTTSIGQSFYLQQKHNGRWYPLYHKMQDIHIGGTKAEHFTITYANGLRETLNHQGYETMLQQQDGWRVYFTYQPGTHRLQSVSDDEGNNIELLYQKDYIKVTSKGSEGQPVSVLLNIKNGELRKLILPLKHSHAGYGMDCIYAGHLLTRINYPTGLTETFTYNCTDAMKVRADKDFLASSLCVIIGKRVDPGAGQPAMQETYEYSKTNSNQHNYLGFNAQLTTTASVKKDILFEAPVNYTYQTQEDNGIFLEIRTYNKYHLLINDQRISDRTRHLLSEIQTFFCRVDYFNACAHLSFEELPLTYSQPLKIITKVWSENSYIPAVTTETYHYDKKGEMIFHKDAYGRLSKISYCSIKGDVDCPAEPNGWNLGVLTKSITVYPASNDPALPPAVVTRNYYRKLPNRKGHDYILVLDHQTRQSGGQQITTTRRYYQDTDNSLTYGLLKQVKLTDNVYRPFGLHEIIHDYYYKRSADNCSKTTYSATELGGGKQRFSSFVTTSLFTNHVLKQIDASGQSTIRYHYDLWDRVVQIEMNSGTTFALSRNYQYTISPHRNQLIITATNGLRSKIIFDGAGRALIHFREAFSEDGKVITNHWIPASKTIYDNYGRIAAQSVYIASPSGKTEALTTTKEYDDSGRIIRSYQPDGEISINQYDDTRRCVVSYQQSANGNYSSVVVTHANILYKPVEQWLFPNDNNALPVSENLCNMQINKNTSLDVKISTMIYDGFGRIIIATDPLGHVIKKEYDTLGRLVNITDPKGNKIHNVYDLSGHVIQHWVQPVSGGNYLLASAEYNAVGELLWRAGEDGLPTQFTYTKEGHLATTTTPDGHTMALQYNVIGLPISKKIDGKFQIQTSYNPVTLLVKKQTDNTGKTLFTYSDDGLLLYLQHIGTHGYLNYKLQWKYDQNRRIVSVTDINANQTQNIYDKLGRLTEVHYRSDHGKTEILSTLNYDDFSRVITVHYGSGMQRKIAYNSFGHPKNIRDRLNGRLLSSWSFYYDANNNITIQIYKAANDQQATFNYKYDALNNLATMICIGSSGLPLCPRDTDFSKISLQKAPVITRQDYYFTSLNRMAKINESLQSLIQNKSIKKIIHYHYTDSSVPMRIQNINITWNNQPELVHTFSYDSVGNMVTDGEGNHIIYNAFNQITRIIKPDGEESYYGYDGSGREIYEKSRSGIHFLFYQGHNLINERISTSKETAHTIGYQGIAKTIDGVIQQYNESNYKGDVIGVLTKKLKNDCYQLSQRIVYSPYGMRWNANKNSLPAYQQTLLGFDGERTDPATKWQFLGAGHRTYNPQQRYFVSEDPAGGGYGFGSNNPIMNSDPDGNMPKWLGSAFEWINYFTSFGLSALHAKWANIAGAVVTSALTVATLGGSAYTCGGTLLASAVTAGATVAGSVPVVAATIPANQGLNIAASVIGVMQMVSMAATAAFDIGLCSFAPKRTVWFDAIPLKSLPLSMPARIRTTTAVGLFDVTNFFKTELPDLISYCGGRISVNIKSFDELNTVWNYLYAHCYLMECDAAAILIFAKIMKRPLSLIDIELLLHAKVILREMLYLEDDIGISAERSIKGNYVKRLWKMWTKLYDGIPNCTICIGKKPTTLKLIPLKAGELAFVAAPYHGEIIGKFSDDIYIEYHHVDEQIYFDVRTLDQLEKSFFKFVPYDELYIDYYIIFKQR